MSNQDLIIYTYADPVHIIQFQSNSNDAVDTYLNRASLILDDWVADGRPDMSVGLLLDVSKSGLFSMEHAASKMMGLIGKYETLPALYIAYLADDATDRAPIEAMTGLPPFAETATRALFYSHEKDDAIAWLESRL